MRLSAESSHMSDPEKNHMQVQTSHLCEVLPKLQNCELFLHGKRALGHDEDIKGG